MQLFRCLQKVHPASNFTETITNANSKQSDDKKYRLSKSSNIVKTIKAESIKSFSILILKRKRHLCPWILELKRWTMKTQTMKGHISVLRKHTNSKGCTKPQELYQIKISISNKTFEKVSRMFCSNITTPKISS